MRQVLVKGGKVTVADCPPPALAPGTCLVRVSHSVISSGTESSFVSEGGAAGYLLKKAQDATNLEKVKRKLATVGIKGTLEVIQGKLNEYQTPGYSTAGVIVEVGEGVHGFRKGDRVACAGVGYACHAGYNVTPHQLLTPLPDDLPYEEGAFVALGAVALQGLRRANPSLGETFIVMGLGLIGQLAAQLLRAAGARVIASDPMAARRDLAQRLGALAVCDPSDLGALAAEWSAGYGVDGVLICAASKDSTLANEALALCRPRGRVVVVGQVGLKLDREALFAKELDFGLSSSYGPGRYQSNYEEKGLDYPIGQVRWTEGRNMAEFLRLASEGRVQLRPLISVIESVDQAPAAYEAVTSGEALAALLHYGEVKAEHEEPTRYAIGKSSAPVEGELGVAVLGAGAFASAVHLPHLKQLDGIRLEAVVSATGAHARQAAERFGARYCETDYRKVLEDPAVHAVLIATRHHLHSEMALAAVAAGKHVFVEKPMTLTVAEGEALCAAVAASSVLLTVGFNRRFSPWAQALKAALERRPGPKVMVYRCNAEALPANHWALDPEQGGGRILGEAVHFFDFVCWLVGAAPVSVQATATPNANGTDHADDSFSATLRFPDGSQAVIVYGTAGHGDVGKERIEIFGGDGAAVIDDFRSLSLAGYPGESGKSKTVEKGQRALLTHFVRAIQGKEPLLVTAEDGLRATRVAWQVMEACRQ